MGEGSGLDSWLVAGREGLDQRSSKANDVTYVPGFGFHTQHQTPKQVLLPVEIGYTPIFQKIETLALGLAWWSMWLSHWEIPGLSLIGWGIRSL